jgi:hypothetical protein
LKKAQRRRAGCPARTLSASFEPGTRKSHFRLGSPSPHASMAKHEALE